jgi:hypothetical protein
MVVLAGVFRFQPQDGTSVTEHVPLLNAVERAESNSGLYATQLRCANVANIDSVEREVLSTGCTARISDIFPNIPSSSRSCSTTRYNPRYRLRQQQPFENNINPKLHELSNPTSTWFKFSEPEEQPSLFHRHLRAKQNRDIWHKRHMITLKTGFQG